MYLNKYLKYKIKYLNVKNQIGGENINDGFINKLWNVTDLNPNDIFFIQIGSNCGNLECATCGEPIWDDCKQFMWKGIVMKPVVSSFEKLKKNYSYNKNVTPYNLAISDKDGKLTFYEGTTNLDRGSEASSFSKDHAIKHRLNIKEIQVDSLTLENLMNLIFWKKDIN